MDELIRRVGGIGYEKMGFNIPGISIAGCEECTLCINSGADPMVLLSSVPYDYIEADYFTSIDEFVSVKYFASPQDVGEMIPFINRYLGSDLAMEFIPSDGDILSVSVLDGGSLLYEKDFDMTDASSIVEDTERLCLFLAGYCISMNNR